MLQYGLSTPQIDGNSRFFMICDKFQHVFWMGPSGTTRTLCIYQSPLPEPEPLAECSVSAEGSANFVAEGSASAEGGSSRLVLTLV